MSNPPSKAALRHAALGRRDALSSQVRADAARVLAGYVDRLPIPAGSMVSGFWPIRSEIDPRPLMEGLAVRGCRLCLPVVVDRIRIVFRTWTPDADLIETGFGTRGPGPEAPVVDP
ncbi:MAG: 5-formyltetrahydrofolate cyclo-ligase, partial [Pseudomonadota bacterium]